MKIPIFSICIQPYIIVLCLVFEIGFAQTVNISVTTPNYNGMGSRTDFRSFLYHLPSSGAACNMPLMLVFHGDGGNGAGMQSSTGMNAVADANNFVVVYPNALVNPDWSSTTFNYRIDQPLFGGAALDSSFTIAIIDYFYKNYGINKAKVYATGHSSGANMVYYLSAKLSTAIAAYAPVAGYPQDWGGGTVWDNYMASTSTPAMPLLHIHGTADVGSGVDFSYSNLPSNPYPAIPTSNNSNPYIWPIFKFSNKNCANSSANYMATSYNGNNLVDKLTFCNTPKEIAFLVVRGLGHSWPTATNAGHLNASQAIWDFCKKLFTFDAQFFAIH